MAKVHIELKCGDALAEVADVLVLKHAQGRFGVDKTVGSILEAAGRRLRLPQPWNYSIESAAPGITASRILFLGVPPLSEFNYKEIRAFAFHSLSILAEQLPHARHLVFTLHGSGYGLDETEAFQAEIAGLVETIQLGQCPSALEQVTIVEQHEGPVRRLTAVLDALLPDRTIAWAAPATTRSEQASQTLRTAGIEADAKPRVFVAMPFKDEMDDTYHYGIVSAVNAAGYLCERADMSSFTGDVLEWVKTRIRSASLVIADLTEANPNVYLEVGYAWGVGIPTILIVRKEQEVKFDVRGQRRLVYGKIKELEYLLTAELRSLSIPD